MNLDDMLLQRLDGGLGKSPKIVFTGMAKPVSVKKHSIRFYEARMVTELRPQLNRELI